MKRLFLVLGTAVMVLPWLTAARAQADLINIGWGATATVETANHAGFVPTLNLGFGIPPAPLPVNIQMVGGNYTGINSATLGVDYRRQCLAGWDKAVAKAETMPSHWIRLAEMSGALARWTVQVVAVEGPPRRG